MFELNNLAKYKLSQLEGELNQRKRVRAKYWILVIIFSTLMSVTAAFCIIAACLYAFKYDANPAMKYVAIATSAFCAAFLIVFFVFVGLHHQQTIVIKKINNYLKEHKK